MGRVTFLRPSGAATWVVCTGYIAMRAMYPDAPDEADNDVREDGTACHWLASEVHAGRYPQEGSLSPNNRVIDEEMFDAVDMYLDVIRGWRVPAHVERKLPIACIYPGMEGTPDAWAYDAPNRTLYVADLKYGFRFVDVWENYQLICYIAAILELLGINGYDEQFINVVATIVQPRSFHREGPVRTWRINASQLRAQINYISGKAHEAMAGGVCTPNPGCTDCPARHACVALQQSALTAVEQSYASIPLELPPSALATELSLLTQAQKRLEARLTGLQAQAESALRNGTVVPGWQLAATYARERWQESSDGKVIAMGKLYGVDLAKPQRAITPAQARKLLPKGMAEMYSCKPSTGVKLVPVDKNEIRRKLT